MSELLNNSEKRKELLKHMILQLHAGEAPDLVRNRLVQILASIPYDEVVEVEQELINEGLPAEEVLQFCDIHTMVLDGHIDQSGAKAVPEGHPVDTFLKENEALQAEISKAEAMFASLTGLSETDTAEFRLGLRRIFNALMDVDKHYKRKEYLVFPFLEKYGITGPPKVMWGKHDETREYMKTALEALTVEGELGREDLQGVVDFALKPALQAIGDMIMKENEILFPMCMDKLSDLDWYQVYNQTIEFGYCLYDPAVDWKPEGLQADEEYELPQGFIQMPSGNFRLDELTAVFNTLPIDITFVDKDDKVRFFSMGPDRIFPRNRAILGRDVRLCHPPSSVNVVDQILNDFKSGKENSAPFWIQLHGKFIFIEYFALRDKDGQYLGTLEFSQDLTPYRALEGEQRLLSYAPRT
ncbi:MAG TPA: DUF438 domain-containing protein [Bacteroidales bacterium]|nr:DUF438 domain-containing protein [Bacteroidales bacterium]HSA42442.1 DUF438 domain-containing protein [Bacteroidales bacterium]